MELIERNFDVITGKNDLRYLCTLKQFPVFLGCTSEPQKKDLTFDMNWYISAGSGCVQMNPVLPLELVYMNSHESSSIGGVWRLHHQQFAKFIYDAIVSGGGTKYSRNRRWERSFVKGIYASSSRYQLGYFGA